MLNLRAINEYAIDVIVGGLYLQINKFSSGIVAITILLFVT